MVKPRPMAPDVPNRLSRHLTTMAYNNAWANHRLLKAICQLPPAEFAAKRVGFFPSLKATVSHNLTVDWFYADALERSLAGKPLNPEARGFFEPEEPLESCTEIHAAQLDVDRLVIEVCRGLTDARLDTKIAVAWKSGVGHEPVLRLLSHLFQHQIHHRGQAHAMLAGTSVAPPQLDEFFCSGEAALRAKDLAELGYSEAMIWEVTASD